MLNTAWQIYPGDELSLDGFIDWGLDQPLVDASVTANQIMQPHQRGLILRNINPFLEYSFWVEAFRKVDQNVDPSGIISSNLIPAPSGPYVPNDNTPFDGLIENTLTGPDPGAVARIWADLTANVQSVMNTPSGVTIQQDSSGVPITGSYPVTFPFTRVRGPTDVTGSSQTVFSVVGYTGGLNSGNLSINTTTGDPNKGLATLTEDGTHPTGSFIIQSTYGGASPLQGTVVVGFNKAAPPTNSTTSSFTNVTATSTDTVITSVLNQVANGTSIACQAASIQFWVGVSNTYGTCHADLKWQWSANGTTGWSDVGSYVTETSGGTASSSTKYGFIPGSPGTITCNQTLSGLTNGVLYYFRLVAKSISAPSVAYPMMFSGSCSLT